MEIDFRHRQSAHCECGATANLLYHHGIPITEAMTFGIGSGLFFGYFPFIKINYLPLITFRTTVGGIIKRVSRRLGVKLTFQKFRNPEKAMNALDALLDSGTPVGCRTGAYWLPYFPPAYRFHFNMHNLVVIGKTGDDYIISDPVFPEPVMCPRKDFMKARFSEGPLSPKGQMYFISHVPTHIDFTIPIKKGIREVCLTMLYAPGPIIGVKGIRFLARQIERWMDKLGKRKALLYLGQIVRMQEEIGTGGAGFRFIFAAFLQEASDVMKDDRLLEFSQTVTRIGDCWRNFAVIAARNCKGRNSETETFHAMGDVLRDISFQEENLLKDLWNVVKTIELPRSHPLISETR